MAAIVEHEVLEQVISRIVGAVHPRRIVLFGSAARGEMGPNSDYDLMVVVADGTHRGEASKKAYRALWGTGFAVDIVVVTETDLVACSDFPFYVIRDALTDGVELYRAAA